MVQQVVFVMTTDQEQLKSIISYVNKSWGKHDPNDIVEEISKGKLFPTQALLLSNNGSYRTCLIKAGVVDKILEFLLQSDQDFETVLPLSPTTSSLSLANTHVDGLIKCPSIWIQIIASFCKDGFCNIDERIQKQIQYKVMNNISGLFQDMSNFKDLTLFGSKDFWIISMQYFTALLSHLITSKHKEIGSFLIRQPSVKQYLVQIIYLDLGNDVDPTINDDIEDFVTNRDNRIPKHDIIGSSQSYCAFAIKTVTENRKQDNNNNNNNNNTNNPISSTRTNDYQNKNYELLGEFAVTPICPSHHELRFGTGIVALLEKSYRDGFYQGGYSSMLFLFLRLYDWGGRLSSKFNGIDCVSSNLVPICSKHLLLHASKQRDHYFFENVSTGLIVIISTLTTPIMIEKKSGQQRQAPIDYNVANAVYNGLVEFCLDVCDCNDGRLVPHLQRLLKIIYSIVQFPDTKKSIRTKEKELRAKIERVTNRPPYLFSCLPIIEKIIDAVTDAAAKNYTNTDNNNTTSADDVKDADAPCQFCSKKCTDEKKMRKCPFCKSVIYCSSDCLQKNWLLHQNSCVLLRKYPKPKSKSDLVCDGKQIFVNQIHKILLQASLKGFSILFCIVVIDMVEPTPLLRTLTYDQFMQSYFMMDYDVRDKIMKNFERNQNDGSLTVSMIGFTNDGLSINMLTFPPDSIPAHLFSSPSVIQKVAFDTEKWTATQKSVAGISLKADGLKKLQRNPQMWKASLLKSMKP